MFWHCNGNFFKVRICVGVWLPTQAYILYILSIHNIISLNNYTYEMKDKRILNVFGSHSYVNLSPPNYQQLTSNNSPTPILKYSDNSPKRAAKLNKLGRFECQSKMLCTGNTFCHFYGVICLSYANTYLT